MSMIKMSTDEVLELFNKKNPNGEIDFVIVVDDENIHLKKILRLNVGKISLTAETDDRKIITINSIKGSDDDKSVILFDFNTDGSQD